MKKEEFWVKLKVVRVKVTLSAELRSSIIGAMTIHELFEAMNGK